MKVEGKSTRFHERTRLEIPVEIDYSETAENEWKETTQTENVTICGVGFMLSRPVEPQRVIHLRLPMPKRLRLFDHGKELYNIWAIIRDVRIVATNIQNKICIKVGTALIGEKPPQSFLHDPTTLYDLKPVLRNQRFWDFRELPRRAGKYARSFDERRNMVTAVTFETIDEQGQIIESIEAVTQNISEGGMAIIAKLPAKYPEYVLVKTQNESLPLLAKVRAVRVLDSGNNLRLHLEFISGKWSV